MLPTALALALLAATPAPATAPTPPTASPAMFAPETPPIDSTERPPPHPTSTPATSPIRAVDTAPTPPTEPPLAPATPAPATTAPASQPGLATLRVEARRSIEARLGALPDLGEKRLADILTVTVENGRLTVDSPLPDTNGPARVTLPELPGIVILTVMRRSAPDSPADAIPQSIQLQRYQFDDPDAIFVESSLSALPGMINISTSAEGIQDGGASVQIIQHIPIFLDPESPQVPEVSVYVQSFSDADPATETARLRLAALDWPTLRREHPAEVRQYVRPALARLGLAPLVEVDPAIAWQVFPEAYRSDPAMAGRIQAILPRLESPDFRVRQAAADELAALGPAGALELMAWDRSTLGPEQKSRIDEAMAAYRTLTPARIDSLRNDKSFLLDCLLLDEPRLRSAAFARLTAVFGLWLDFDPDAAPATRSARVDALRQQLLPPPATRNAPSH